LKTDIGKANEATASPPIAISSAINGINYSKGLNWLTNYNTLRHKEIDEDLKAIRKLGLNTIKRYGPNIYDKDILKTAEAHQLKVMYAFYLPDDIDFINGHKQMKELQDMILKTVKEHKNNKTILAWNLGNTPLQKLENKFYKPQLIYNRYACTEWLNTLISQIRAEDPSRQVSLDVEVNDSFIEDLTFLKNQVPGIDNFGLVITERSPNELDFSKLNSPYFLSKIHAKSFLEKANNNEGFFISDWQDQERKGLVTFDGLRDNWGRNKVLLYDMGKRLNTISHAPVLPKIKILKPAVTLYSGGKYKYQALVDLDNEWKLAEDAGLDLEYRWYLVKTDSYGNGTSIEFIGSGTRVSVKLPKGYKHYQLYLNAFRGNDVSTAKTRLNIPLVTRNPAN